MSWGVLSPLPLLAACSLWEDFQGCNSPPHPWDPSVPQILLWTRGDFLLCQWNFSSQHCLATWIQLLPENLQTQAWHVVFYFATLLLNCSALPYFCLLQMGTDLASEHCCKHKHAASNITPGQSCFATCGISKQYHLSVSQCWEKKMRTAVLLPWDWFLPCQHCFTVTETFLLMKYLILTYANH